MILLLKAKFIYMTSAVKKINVFFTMTAAECSTPILFLTESSKSILITLVNKNTCNIQFFFCKNIILLYCQLLQLYCVYSIPLSFKIMCMQLCRESKMNCPFSLKGIVICPWKHICSAL